MKLYPNTLLGRTILVVALVLIITQSLAVSLFRAYNRGPLFDEMAELIIGQLRIVSTALETLPEGERVDFLDILEERQGIRIVPESGVNLPSNIPQSPLLKDFTEHIKNKLGQDTAFFVQQKGANTLWVKLTINHQKYWVSIPRKQIERNPPWLIFGWMAFSALLVLVGAYVLARRVNQPLHKLSLAAHELGAGKTPESLEETGPIEVIEVSRAFNKMAEDLRAYDTERTLLLAGISHDLRTPLSRLRLSLELTKNVEQDLRDGMVQDIEEADAIIQQFLSFAHTAVDEPLETTDLNVLVEQTVKRYQALGHDIHAEIMPLPEFQVRPLAIQRVLDNLITNAIKYAGTKIIVRTSEENNRVVLSVIDNGPGIPENQIERLKQPFTRFEPARSNAGNAGLGLAIVERIAILHQAKFELLNNINGGINAKIIFSSLDNKTLLTKY